MGVSREIPLSEITLRRYEKPYYMEKRELMRKLCLSVGLLQPGDSRDIIVDILHVLHDAKKSNLMMNSEDIQKNVIELRKKKNLAVSGVASSNIRRQVRRLREVFLVEKIKNQYRISEFDDFNVIFKDKIQKLYIDNILGRVEDYFNAIK